MYFVSKDKYAELISLLTIALLVLLQSAVMPVKTTWVINLDTDNSQKIRFHAFLRNLDDFYW
jgi:hypothetical protein